MRSWHIFKNTSEDLNSKEHVVNLFNPDTWTTSTPDPYCPDSWLKLCPWKAFHSVRSIWSKKAPSSPTQTCEIVPHVADANAYTISILMIWFFSLFVLFGEYGGCCISKWNICALSSLYNTVVQEHIKCQVYFMFLIFGVTRITYPSLWTFLSKNLKF